MFHLEKIYTHAYITIFLLKKKKKKTKNLFKILIKCFGFIAFIKFFEKELSYYLKIMVTVDVLKF